MSTTRKTRKKQVAAGEFQPRLLRLAVAAKYLSVSPGTLRRLIQQGQLSVVRISNGVNCPWLLDQHDLDKFIERTKVTL
jgi:excisionase family DNA binding protein